MPSIIVLDILAQEGLDILDQAGIDYVGLDTSMQFDRALIEYLTSRRARF